MALYEVEVRRNVTDYYEVDAKNEDDARRRWYTDGTEAGTIVHSVTIESVIPVFEDDGVTYDIEFEGEDREDG
jgi:hypothetical protein